MELSEILRSYAELESLDDGELDAFSGAFDVRDIAVGDVLVDGEADAVYLVLSGVVAATTRVGDDDVELARMDPGEVVAAWALVGVGEQSTRYVAVESGRVAALPLTRWREIKTTNSALALAFRRVVGRQLARDFREVAAKVRDLLQPADEDADDGHDVAVIGGGMLGLTYATFLSQRRPASNVVVVERKPAPGYKIGESTLGTTTRCMRTLGLSFPVLRRLFGNKSGIRFWVTDTDTHDLHRHIDAVDIDETFQVERRVLETALTELARRRGITVQENTRVNVKASTFGPAGNQLVCVGPDDEEIQLRAKVICDATGPAAVLPRHFGVYRKDMDLYDTFNTNSYYAYFRKTGDVDIPYWDQPTTRHICFPQGWMWFINLVSWQQTPDENLQAMIAHLLDHPEGPDESYPSRWELAERFGCTSERLVSIGFVIRNDRDTADDMPIAERFQHYVDRYPAIKRVMSAYDVVEAPYEKRTPYSAFQKLAHDCTQIAGDGWVAIGDAAMFTNPLFSPGLNFGTGTAFMAARDTAAALDAGDTSEGAFADYQRYGQDVFRALLHENDMLYRSFNHPDSFERALMLKFFFGAKDVLVREEYSETDPYFGDLLNPVFVEKVDAVRTILRDGEQAGTDPAQVAKQVAAVLDPFFDDLLSSPELQRLQIGRVFTEYTDSGERVEGREKPPGPFGVLQCATCEFFFDGTLQRCPVCATASPVA